ncbi:MAG: hypothetical protein COB50_04135, partial [Thiotrichales bacterium]
DAVEHVADYPIKDLIAGNKDEYYKKNFVKEAIYQKFNMVLPFPIFDYYGHIVYHYKNLRLHGKNSAYILKLEGNPSEVLKKILQGKFSKIIISAKNANTDEVVYKNLLFPGQSFKSRSKKWCNIL